MITISIPTSDKILQIQKQINLYKMKEKISKEEKWMIKVMSLWIKEELKKINFMTQK